jgi:hypothetical protein
MGGKPSCQALRTRAQCVPLRIAMPRFGMFFVVDRRLLQRTLAIVRDDRSKNHQGTDGPFMRLEARDGYLKLDGLRISARISATVYEQGVLFLRVTIFRRLLGTLSGQPFLSIQVMSDGMLMDRIRLPLDANDMLLYPNPQQAPTRHPSESLRQEVEEEAEDRKPQPECDQLRLWSNFDK